MRITQDHWTQSAGWRNLGDHVAEAQLVFYFAAPSARKAAGITKP